MSTVKELNQQTVTELLDVLSKDGVSSLLIEEGTVTYSTPSVSQAAHIPHAVEIIKFHLQEYLNEKDNDVLINYDENQTLFTAHTKKKEEVKSQAEKPVASSQPKRTNNPRRRNNKR